MATKNSILHRSKRIAAKSIHLGRRVMAELRTKSDTEILMDALPEIATAKAGLAGKVVVISGSTQGIGLAVARRFADLGAKIVINGRREDAVQTAIAELAKDGINVAGITADVATEKGARALIAKAVSDFGSFDILINNAAIAGPHKFIWDVTPDEMVETLDINLKGPILCTMEAIKWLVSNGKQGRIINLSSIATEVDYPKMIPYSTTKAGLESFTRFVSADLAKAEVVITSLILPSVQTERKFAADWASTELLPPVESILPAFEFAATGPAEQLHGRTLSAGRFIMDPTAEAALAGVAATRKQIEYPVLKIGGQVVARDPAALTLLDRAENQHGTSPKALAAISQSLKTHAPAFYPDERFMSLRTALANEHDLTPENFALGPGSWELISRIVQIFVKPGETVVSSGPGWFGFNVTCQRHGALQHLVPLDRGATGNTPNHNLDEMRRAITPRTRLVYLISPSNPEGVTLKHQEVVDFLADIPPNLPVLIDEAYAEFADDPDMVDVPALIRDSDRAVIGLRTFSKFYAMAGLRVGYAYARPELVDLIRRSEQIFTLAHVAEVAAVAALNDHDHRAKVYAAALDARNTMQSALTDLGINHIPSHAPYIFADAPERFDDIIESLAQDGIIAAPYRFNNDATIMLPVGSAEQNAKILAALERFK